jgi:hypothetical protein
MQNQRVSIHFAFFSRRMPALWQFTGRAASGRVCEVVTGRFVAFKSQNRCLAEQPLFKKLADHQSAHYVHFSSDSIRCPLVAGQRVAEPASSNWNQVPAVTNVDGMQA